MQKFEIEAERRIPVEINSNRYSVEYAKSEHLIVLKRRIDNTIIKVFDDKIGFIVQHDDGENTDFLVTEYARDSQGKIGIKLRHYIDSFFRGFRSESLRLVKEFDSDSMFLEHCRITNSSYLIDRDRRIYNLHQVSESFSRIYMNKKIEVFLGKGIVLVSDKMNNYLCSPISDTITYGINPETFEIVTPIWSELQQRYIDVYTKEQIDKINEELSKIGQHLNTRDYSIGQLTIYLEIKKYLKELTHHLQRPQTVYIDTFEFEINEDFVKRFKK